ncbi:MAG: chromate transporter [Vicinamibacterales bacterium]
MNTPATTEAPKDLIGFLDFYLVKKAPFQIPDAGREWIVKFGPWITVVLLILTLPILLVALGIGTVFVPFGGIGYATGFGFLTVFIIAEVGLMIAALPGLFARKMAGWRLLFYSQLVSIAYHVLSLNIVGGLLFGLIGLYILFQVRPLYHE